MIKKAKQVSKSKIVNKKTPQKSLVIPQSSIVFAKWGTAALIAIAVISALGGLIYLVKNLQESVSNLNTKIEALSQDNTGKTQNNSASNAAPTTGSTSIKDSAKKGNTNAKVAVIEFSDFECPFCKRAFSQTLPEIQKNFIDTNKIVYSFRHLPLSFHEPLASLEAEATECAREQKGDGGFFGMHDAIFAKTESNKANMTLDIITGLGTQIGLDSGAFTTCINGSKFDARIKADIADASKLGMSGTPAFLIGKYDANTGKVEGEIIKGAVPYDTFKVAIEKYLK